jgi:hypothetical protein
MIRIVNLNNNIEKELELEHQGLRRTRRWIGDANQVAEDGWYRAKINKISGSSHNLNQVSQVANAKPRWQANSAILKRLSSLFNTSRRQPVSSKS